MAPYRLMEFPTLDEKTKARWSKTIRARVAAGGYNAGHGYDGIDKDTLKCGKCQ